MTEATAPRVDPGNTDQARAWDGGEGEYWAAHADQYDEAVRDLHPALVAAAAIEDDDRVLDIGCGAGQTTLDAARLARHGHALGVDLSSAMLAVARTRAKAAGLDNVEFVRADVQVHPFAPAAHDVALSRNGVMFCADPGATFANVARSLRPGGRLALLTWQGLDGNEWLRSFATALAAGRDLPRPGPDRPGPLALSDAGRIRALLDAAGFADVLVAPLEGPVYFGRDAGSASDFVLGQLGWMLEGLDTDGRERAIGALQDSLEAHETADGVAYRSAAWITTARRAG